MPGGLGLLARSKIAKERKESAGPAVAKLLASGMGEVDAGALAAVATEYGAPAHGHTQPPLPPRRKHPSSAPAPPRGRYASQGRLVALGATPTRLPPSRSRWPRDGHRRLPGPNPGVEKKAFKAQP